MPDLAKEGIAAEDYQHRYIGGGAIFDGPKNLFPPEDWKRVSVKVERPDQHGRLAAESVVFERATVHIDGRNALVVSTDDGIEVGYNSRYWLSYQADPLDEGQ
jgi:hypothetical protein